jgi:hypothetical protein
MNIFGRDEDGTFYAIKMESHFRKLAKKSGNNPQDLEIPENSHQDTEKVHKNRKDLKKSENESSHTGKVHEEKSEKQSSPEEKRKEESRTGQSSPDETHPASTLAAADANAAAGSSDPGPLHSPGPLAGMLVPFAADAGKAWRVTRAKANQGWDIEMEAMKCQKHYVAKGYTEITRMMFNGWMKKAREYAANNGSVNRGKMDADPVAQSQNGEMDEIEEVVVV